jgi:hypothetical protein
MKAHFLMSWAQTMGSRHSTKRTNTRVGTQTDGTPRRRGLFSKDPSPILETRGREPTATPLMKGKVIEMDDL